MGPRHFLRTVYVSYVFRRFNLTCHDPPIFQRYQITAGRGFVQAVFGMLCGTSRVSDSRYLHQYVCLSLSTALTANSDMYPAAGYSAAGST